MTTDTDAAPCFDSLGPATWARCAALMGEPDVRLYEIGHLLSASAPQSPFAAPVELVFQATAGVPGTVHAHNGERLAGALTQQGTHLDAPGHFGERTEPWSGAGAFPTGDVAYFGGRSAAEVKPGPMAGLAQLGVDRLPPIMTSAVILDATAGRAGGAALEAGEVIGAADLDAMMAASGLADRGILPGDALLIHTGWGRRWHDPDDGRYYTSGPGLGLDAARWMAERRVAIVGLDNPFTDPVAPGQLAGGGELPRGVDGARPFQVHAFNLVRAGVLQMQNLALGEVVADGVRLAAFLALPLRIAGASGSPIRPVLVGRAWREV